MTPPDDRGDREVLAEAAQTLGLKLTAAQCDRLLSYRERLVRWNAVFNLSAVRDPGEMLRRHVIDCLALVLPLARVVEQRGLGGGGPLRVLDVGSGAGLPGVVLGVVRPDWRIDCVDTVGKKVAFVRQAVGELGLSGVRAWHARVEQWPGDPAGLGYDVVTCRAFASLSTLVDLTRRLLAPRGVWVAMKGGVPDDEIAALPEEVRVFHVEPIEVPGLEARRCLVWMERKTA